MNTNLSVQHHLNYSQRINLGSYYTKPEIVDFMYGLLKKNIQNFNDYCILDTSCGYGSFFRADLPNRKIGADIDLNALKEAEKNFDNIEFYHQNGLQNVNRAKYNLSQKDNLIIVGNPPYNDRTSIIRHSVKLNDAGAVDDDINTRDLGISFMLSYNKLCADFVCVLHPLSYLIKKPNFSLLKPFMNNYQLLDSLIISSGVFSQTSKTMSFPIIIALYKKCLWGMDYEFVKQYDFKTKENKKFKLEYFDLIERYIAKYPNQQSVRAQEAVAKFWTMRDINALKRNKTFIDEICPNAVFVTKDKFDYYCYVDVFKEYAKNIPYYFGNCDVMIDNKKFLELRDCFRFESIKNNPCLSKKFSLPSVEQPKEKIDIYFKNLLGEHYAA